jgi:hypothetical protein
MLPELLMYLLPELSIYEYLLPECRLQGHQLGLLVYIQYVPEGNSTVMELLPTEEYRNATCVRIGI